MTKTLRRIQVVTAAMAVLAALGCNHQTITGLTDAPSLGKGSSKPGGTTSIGVPVTKLGNLKLIGCTWADAYAISSAAAPLVVGMAGGCSSPAYNKPFIWSAAGTAATGKSLGGWPMAVSDNGFMVGGDPGGAPAEFDMTGTAKALPLPIGVTWGQATGITPDGRFAVGYGSTGNNPYKALWWSRSRVTDPWQVAEVIGEGIARAVTADGNLVVGASGGNAVAWRRSGTATWTRVELQPAGLGEARAVSALGTMIAGERELPLATDPTRTFGQHTVWIASEGNWVAQKLKGADPNFDEGEAFGIADQTDGSTLAVGFSWQDTSGPGGNRWAVAWRRGSGATSFGPPILLQPLSSTSGAIAYGVNTKGMVVGTANTGNGGYPVMWNVSAVP